MKRKFLPILVISLALMILLGGRAWIAEPAYAQTENPPPVDPSLGAPEAAQALVGNTFTFQGRLEKDGQSVNGACDMIFSLYDTQAFPLQIGVNESHAGVAVQDGFFTVILNGNGFFGERPFPGEARQLQVSTKCAGDGSYTALPYIPIGATPYALSLRPGAVITGSVGDASVLKLVNTANTIGADIGLWGKSTSSYRGFGVYGESSGMDSMGVMGYTSDTFYRSWGVYGQAASTSGVGVYGTAPITGVVGVATGSGSTVGVLGRASSNQGIGVKGEGVLVGVRGQGYMGVHGIGTGGSNSTGVTGSGDIGLWGMGYMTGTHGIADTATGKVGVYGQASNASAYGVKGFNSVGTGVFSEGSTRGLYAKGGQVGIFSEATDTTNGVAVSGKSVASSNAAGKFINVYTTNPSESAVGVWAGSYYGDVFQGHDLNSSGESMNRVFRVTYTGNVYADGTYYGEDGVSSGSADFAEMVTPGEADLEAGDVLAIGMDGNFVRSTQPYQATVVGVYSTKPGFIAGNKLDEDGNPLEPGRIPLAVVGIVPVKASAENGAIQPGDMLTAASIPGHAMKAGANPPVGTVIGKALQGLESGTGVIVLLVMLQ